MNNNISEQLVLKLKDKKATIGIIGLGYVGLPLCLTYVENGYKVLGFDINEKVVNNINEGISYIKHIDSERIKISLKNKLFSATTDYGEISKVDAIIICVPTPLTVHRDPDLSYILKTMNSIKTFLKKAQIISLESTTYPGTTEEILRPIIESTGKVIGEDFFLVYSPEREDPGNKNYNTKNIPKILGGTSKNCEKVGLALYQNTIDKVVCVTSTKAAEMTKLLENIHRSVNIGLMNELKQLTEKMDIDLYEIINAAATKPFGFVAYYPGPGLGGHCIPIDPFYLTWKAREYGMHTRFIELAGEINTFMPSYVVQQTSKALNKFGKSIKGSKILILGLAYKKNIDDLRESPSLCIMSLLRENGSLIDYSDPYFPVFPKLRNHSCNLKSIELNSRNLKEYDLVILATDHDLFDYEEIYEYSKLIIDTRGKYEKCEKVYRA